MGERGRKKGANGEKRRSLLLHIAAEEFSRNGYYETKISTIVQRANVTQPSFYLYFRSKEAIFQELVDIFQQRLMILIQQSLLEPGIEKNTLEEKITEKLTNIFSFFKEQPDLTRIGFYMADQSEKIKKQIASQIEKNLRQEQKSGYFREDIDVPTVAESLIGIIERLTKTKLLNGMATPENLARQIVQLLLYGMMSYAK